MVSAITGRLPDLSVLPKAVAVSNVPKSLRMVDAELMKIEGIQVVINESFRIGVLQLDCSSFTRTVPQLSSGKIICSAATLSWLDSTEQRGGREWGIVANVLRNEIREVGELAASRMVDLTTRGHKVVDRRKVTRSSNDRIEHLVNGISDLTSQMASMLAGHVEATPKLVAGTAKRYAELSAEMKEIRTLFLKAEGMFDVAQAQVMALMGDD